MMIVLLDSYYGWVNNRTSTGQPPHYDDEEEEVDTILFQHTDHSPVSHRKRSRNKFNSSFVSPTKGVPLLPVRPSVAVRLVAVGGDWGGSGGVKSPAITSSVFAEPGTDDGQSCVSSESIGHDSQWVVLVTHSRTAPFVHLPPLLPPPTPQQHHHPNQCPLGLSPSAHLNVLCVLFVVSSAVTAAVKSEQTMVAALFHLLLYAATVHRWTDVGALVSFHNKTTLFPQ